MFRILITDDLGRAGLNLLEAAADVKHDLLKLPTPEKLMQTIGDYDAVITRSGTPLTAPIFEAAKKLKVAGRAGVGLDNIDIEAATRRGVLVMNTPEANSLAAVELTIGLMLALCRHIPRADASVKKGEWTRSKFMGVQLSGKSLGVIGLGRIGSKVATRCQAFGMKVMAYDPYITEETAERLHVRLVGALEEFLREADFITIHTPLTEETRGMIGAKEFALMKDGVRIINCARGGIIEEKALLDALSAKKVAGVGLDVYLKEPPKGESIQQLLSREEVVATPHIGANTWEAQRDVAVQVVQQVIEALRGENLRNVVNLPFPEGVDYRSLAPYMELAEKIGSLQMQMILGRIRRLEVEFRGEDVEPNGKPLTVALLKGILSPILSEDVNYVNASHLADQRGIQVTQTRHPAAQDYSNVILCRAVSTRETRLIGGALFLHKIPRIVLLDDYRIDALPSGPALILSNRDIPGVIGKVGTLLGDRGINIAEWQMGRNERGGMAVSFINIDTPASESVLQELRALSPILEVRQVKL
ncbi:MAG: phosphoglycerate dehydrogenase [Syntrophaceae bacterium]|nr:phosphoglycerate dehydrogenase [Syntrophaceae bacterium]